MHVVLAPEHPPNYHPEFTQKLQQRSIQHSAFFSREDFRVGVKPYSALSSKRRATSVSLKAAERQACMQLNASCRGQLVHISSDKHLPLTEISIPEGRKNTILRPRSDISSGFSSYDVLRGKSRILPSGETEPVSKDTTTYHELSTAMWRAKQRRRADLSVGGVDERWKERMMMATIFFSIAAFVLQAYTTRREAIQASLEKASEARHRHYNDSYILNARQPKPSLSAEDSALAAEGPHNPKPSS
ncbi:hypothetical protein ABKN59_007236 [Abortiporus biennis]